MGIGGSRARGAPLEGSRERDPRSAASQRRSECTRPQARAHRRSRTVVDDSQGPRPQPPMSARRLRDHLGLSRRCERARRRCRPGERAPASPGARRRARSDPTNCRLLQTPPVQGRWRLSADARRGVSREVPQAALILGHSPTARARGDSSPGAGHQSRPRSRAARQGPAEMGSGDVPRRLGRNLV